MDNRPVQAAEPTPDRLPERHVTLNQLVGYNMAFFRREAGLTQEELGRRLGGWTKIAVSAAERSWDGKRIRKFDADEIVAIADVLGVPALALLLPPENAGTQVDYVIVPGSAPVSPIDGTALLAHLLPSSRPAGSRAMDALLGRLAAFAARGAHDPVSEEVTRQAVARSAGEPEAATTAAAQQGEIEVERRITELRAFERGYRARLLAFMEEQIHALRAGADDEPAAPQEQDSRP